MMMTIIILLRRHFICSWNIHALVPLQNNTSRAVDQDGTIKLTTRVSPQKNEIEPTPEEYDTQVLWKAKASQSV